MFDNILVNLIKERFRVDKLHRHGKDMNRKAASAIAFKILRRNGRSLTEIARAMGYKTHSPLLEHRFVDVDDSVLDEIELVAVNIYNRSLSFESDPRRSDCGEIKFEVCLGNTVRGSNFQIEYNEGKLQLRSNVLDDTALYVVRNTWHQIEVKESGCVGVSGKLFYLIKGDIVSLRVFKLSNMRIEVGLFLVGDRKFDAH